MAVAETIDAPAALDARAVVSAYWSPRRLIWAVAVTGIALRAWVVTSGWFYWDDYIFQGRAWRFPLDSSYLLYGHDGHFMPGAFLLQWPLTRSWPMGYTPLVVLLIAGQALLVVLFTRLALTIWGSRWEALLAVVLLAFTPMTLPTNTWWAAALNGIPMQISLVVALSCGLAWWRTKSRRWVVVAVVVWALTLLFSEKVLLVPWAVLAAAPLLAPRLSPMSVWRDVIRRTWLLWGGVVVGSVAYLIAYEANVGKTPASDGTADQVADLLGRGLTSTVPTALLGGPLHWEAVGFGSAVGEPPGWFVVVAVELIGALVVVSCLRSRLARRAWAWAWGFVLVDLLLVASGRLNGYVNPEIVQGLRYTADAVVPLALAVPFGLAAVAPLVRRHVRRRFPGRARLVGRAGVAVIVTAILMTSMVSTTAYREIWRANDSRAYISAASASLAAAASGPTLVDQSVPINVLYGLDYPYNQASWLLAPLSPRPEWIDPTTQLLQLDESGVLRPAIVDGPANVPGKTPGCGWLVQGQADITMQSTIFDWVFTVRMGYVASADATATLAIGNGEPRKVAIRKGYNAVVLTLAGGGKDVRIRDLTPGVTVCTDDVRVGHAVVVPK